MKITVSTSFSGAEGVVLVKPSEGKTARLVEKGKNKIELQLGIGKREELTLRKVRTAIRKSVLAVKDAGYSGIAFKLSEFNSGNQKLDEAEWAYAVVENVILADFSFDQFKTKNKKPGLKELILVARQNKALQETVSRARTIAEEVNKCRILANTPGGDMTPKLLAHAAQEAIKGTDIEVNVLGVRTLENEGMGAILGVGKGSTEEPQFIVMEYWGASKDEKPLVLIGKGVTFDTGGLNLKPSDSILEMHMDMSGGAAVIHAIALAARLKLKKNVVALVPAVENMPSGSSYRPGDVLKSMSGKTIEVLNTDAEGRVILADAITYAKRYNPHTLIDVATLTGAALVALGTHAHAVMSRDDAFSKTICDLGEEAGEYAWPLPLWDEYEQYMPGNFGDVANIPAVGNSRYAGVINGGMFLYQFVKDHPKTTRWAHIDMAPRMTSGPGDYLAKGATGEPVRLLLKLAEKL